MRRCSNQSGKYEPERSFFDRHVESSGTGIEVPMPVPVPAVDAVFGAFTEAGAVLASGGIPSGSPDYENQTKPYVAKIRAAEDYFARLLSPFGGSVLSEVGARAVESAMNFIGLPYVWGGGNIHGPSQGGFDCSGLTSYAVYTATAGKVTLPRTSETQ